MYSLFITITPRKETAPIFRRGFAFSCVECHARAPSYMDTSSSSLRTRNLSRVPSNQTRPLYRCLCQGFSSVFYSYDPTASGRVTCRRKTAITRMPSLDFPPSNVPSSPAVTSPLSIYFTTRMGMALFLEMHMDLMATEDQLLRHER